MRKFTSLALAAMLTFGLAASAFATDVPETLTVLATQSITGVPASISYGNVTPGVASTPVNFTVSISSNVAWRVDMTGSNFAGPSLLPRSARQVQIDTLSGAPVPTTTMAAYTPFDNAALSTIPGTGAGEISDSAGAGFGASIHLRILAPFDVEAGDYTGTYTIVIAAS